MTATDSVIHRISSYTGAYQASLIPQATFTPGDQIHYLLGEEGDTWSVDAREHADVDHLLFRKGLSREWSGTASRDEQLWDAWTVVVSTYEAEDRTRYDD